ncbi:GSCFA domain-containing protein [Rhizobium sp. EC-SD404]|uniref:GSCFA domain-containing protein n=1 Tax=Rhizobium sp. EC-SD404 TaxID=2038389 RepID=UPI0018FE32CC|nr:GSCFA domain-containing protein [Rhizobium sp. EC-SD404]
MARNYAPADLYRGKTPLLKPDDRIISAGSCFAANIVPFLERAGFQYLRTESMDTDGDRFGYSRYSASYGNIYTSRQLLQLLQRATGEFAPREDRWIEDDGVYDPFRPGLPNCAEDEDEFEILTRAHLDRVRETFSQSSVLLFTLGLTEAWASEDDGAVFPACPGTIAGTFSAERHRFANFNAHEVATDLKAAIATARQINPDLRVILTVSPVPLVATATDSHVFTATTYSKSVLRVAADDVESTVPGVSYFPAYEIVMGPESNQHFENDLRNVNAKGVAAVVGALFAHCELPEASERLEEVSWQKLLSEELTRRECEETMSDK